MGEIIFEKSLKNLKKIHNRLNSKNLNQYIKSQQEEVLFLAIGGYNRTYELLKAMGADDCEIATFSNLNLTQQFLTETHKKKILYIKKINYVTNVGKNWDFVAKRLDLNVADGFEESLLVYENAQRLVGFGKQKEAWEKPTIVILDDPSLNLQYESHRFRYANKIGFVQVRNRNVAPHIIIAELKEVEEADKMMFAVYQERGVDESEVLDGLNRLKESVILKIEDDWAIKPTDYKKILGSNKLANQLKEMTELGIYQLTTNKKIGKENARWIVIPEKAFEFKGFSYKDEDELFQEQLEEEERSESEYVAQQEKQLNAILSIELPFNVRQGYVGGKLDTTVTTLQTFIDEIDAIESEKINGIELLTDANTTDEYNYIKKYSLAYFLDGNYANNERKDENYQGGKRLLSIDVDEGDYTRQQLEARLESQNLFGLIYPTAKHYYNQAKRWRIVCMADEEMDKAQYKATISGVAQMLDLDIDDASKKISQLMGYPLSNKDLSIVNGTMVSVTQFYKKTLPITQNQNILPFKGTKSLIDFNHSQARLLKQTLQQGAVEGSRNETYRQIYLYLIDTLNNPEMANWHVEAEELIQQTKMQASVDGLPEKEIEVIYR